MCVHVYQTLSLPGRCAKNLNKIQLVLVREDENGEEEFPREMCDSKTEFKKILYEEFLFSNSVHENKTCLLG